MLILGDKSIEASQELGQSSSLDQLISHNTSSSPDIESLDKITQAGDCISFRVISPPHSPMSSTLASNHSCTYTSPSGSSSSSTFLFNNNVFSSSSKKSSTFPHSTISSSPSSTSEASLSSFSPFISSPSHSFTSSPSYSLYNSNTDSPIYSENDSFFPLSDTSITHTYSFNKPMCFFFY
jgi:hypothetical protein